MSVIVYSKPACVQCTASYRALDAAGIDYRVVNLAEEPSALETIKALGYLQAPVVVASESNHWSGFRPDNIKALKP